MAYFRVMIKNFPGGSKDNYINLSPRILSIN